MSRINIIPIFVPHLGCPNDCVFCNQRKITGLKDFNIDDVKKNIETYLDIFKKSNKDTELAFYGGSFTAIDYSLQKRLLEIAKELKVNRDINRIRLSTRPDCINLDILNILDQYLVDIIELGVQSLDSEVLLKSKRGHNVSSVYEATDLIKKRDYKLGLQQMVGLPGDNFEKTYKTAKEIIKLKPDFVRIYPTLVIKNTELEEMYRNNSYTPLDLVEAVEIVSKLIALYEINNVEIIRVGLQATENLQFDQDVVAGPLHDAFRELCESKKLLEIIENIDLDFENENDISIYANNRNVAFLVGQKGNNKNKLMNVLKVNKIKFFVDNNLDDNIKLSSKNKDYTINIKDSLNKLVKGW